MHIIWNKAKAHCTGIVMKFIVCCHYNLPKIFNEIKHVFFEQARIHTAL